MKIATALAAIALLLAGCDRSQPATPAPPAIPAAPTTAPATTASTQPANSSINIDRHTIVFPAARRHYPAPSGGDREDSPYGIYLGGKKLQLQPFEVQGAFKVNEEGTAALISGQFQVVDDSTGRGPPQLIVVAANLPVRVQKSGP